MALKNLDPHDVARLLEEQSILLIDVRETDEYETERIEGALLFPLSAFDPESLPDAQGRSIVFHCAAGGRSAKAVAACQAAGLPIDSHMKGGISAWKAAGLPIVSGKPTPP
jgi:rhodanese-related sulfurtransferase